MNMSKVFHGVNSSPLINGFGLPTQLI